MAKSYSSLNVDGPMRVDANHAGGKQYTPNSFAHKFSPDAAEAPYKVSDNVVSRKSHYYHEGKLSEYDQPRELYQRVMDDKAREALHSNTAKMMSHVNYAIISKRYLAQIYCIDPKYARAVYDLTNFKYEKYDFSEVEEESKNAPTMKKEPKFRPDQDNRLNVGMLIP
jgi:catalase